MDFLFVMLHYFCTFSPEGEKILGLGIKNKQVYFVLLSFFCIFV